MGAVEVMSAEPEPAIGQALPRRRFAVIGSPVDHSLSPVLHRTAYAELGVTDAEYVRHEVGAGELAAFLADGPGRDLQGLSVTMPGKPEAHDLAAERDATATALGIANTLVRRPDGTWRAENHDVHGIVAALRDHGAPDRRGTGSGSPSTTGGAGPTGAVLGSGATALSAVAALVELGAREILLSARSPEKLVPLEVLAAEHGVQVRRVAWEDNRQLLTADLVVSALAVPGAQAVAADWITGGQRDTAPGAVPGVFLDVLYDPWPAPLAGLVGALGGEVADGLEMLAHQADLQVRSMLGVERAPVRAMLEAARRELASRSR